MPKGILRISVLILVVAAAIVGGMYLDHELSRQSRIDATAAIEIEMIAVRDQLLRFEHENWCLPKTLSELAPKYLTSDRISAENGSIYAYNPLERVLKQARGCLITGLWSRRRPPESMSLPPMSPGVEEVRQAEFDRAYAQLERYQQEHGSLPITLESLVPLYLSADDLTRWDEPLYDYDQLKRQLTQVIREPGPTHLAPIARNLPVVELKVTDAAERKVAIALIPIGPKLPDPPKGAFVFEAEHFSVMNWGWEVRPDPLSSGGAYLHCWEGITNGPAQTDMGVFHFWDISPKRDYTRLVYKFHVPKAGRYYVYGRMWTTDTHCSNSVNVGIDEDARYADYMGNRTPFRWVWTDTRRRRIFFTKGDHSLSFFIHEDGVRFDQFMLTPVRVAGGQAYRANLSTGKDTIWLKKKNAPSVHLSFDLKSQVLSPESVPECKVVIRRLRPSQGEATLRVYVEGVLPDNKPVMIAEHKLDLATLPEVCLVPLSFANIDRSKLLRREYLLRAELVQDKKRIPTAQVTLLRPFEWEAAGTFPYIDNTDMGPLDATKEPTATAKVKWKAFGEKHIEHFGVLDFGLFCGNSS